MRLNCRSIIVLQLQTVQFISIVTKLIPLVRIRSRLFVKDTTLCVGYDT